MRTLSLVLTLALAACAPEPGVTLPEPLWNTQWVALTLAGKPVAPPGAITLRFLPGQANGSGGCNSYMGGVTIKGDEIRFENLASTMMACLEEGRMQQEGAYSILLRDAVRFERPSPDRLVILTADGRSVVFTATR